ASTLASVQRAADGRYVLGASAFVKDGPEAPPLPSWPASVDWHLAVACARFAAREARLPLRLPNELEREKATRGADGRLFAWGDHADPAFACVVEGHRGQALP